MGFLDSVLKVFIGDKSEKDVKAIQPIVQLPAGPPVQIRIRSVTQYKRPPRNEDSSVLSEHQ